MPKPNETATQVEPGGQLAQSENTDNLGLLVNGALPLFLPLKPRHKEAALIHGGLPEQFTPHIKKQIEAERALRAEQGLTGPGPWEIQYVARPELEAEGWRGEVTDPLGEEHHTVAPGLVLKYPAQYDAEGQLLHHGRALWTITLKCAAYCRHCTRGHEVGIPDGHVKEPGAEPHSSHLSRAQIDEALAYIENAARTQGLNEIILSGGDPLTVKPEVLHYVLGRLGELQKQKLLPIVRIGTRLPIHNPMAIRDEHYKAIEQIKNPHLMIHVNHASELTPETIAVWDRLRGQCLATIRTQSVLLRGVNDSRQALLEMAQTIVENGGVPYYLFQCDEVYWAKHLIVPIMEAIELWLSIRVGSPSGLLTHLKFVIDVAQQNGVFGFGKVPVPEAAAWNVIWTDGFKDAHGQHFDLY